MLAVVHKSVAQAPEELSVPEVIGSPDCLTTTGNDLLSNFKAAYPDAMSLHFDGNSAMAFTHKNQSLLRPRTLAVVDDVYCICVGMLENLAMLRQRYGLGKSVHEVELIIEMYRSLRDRGGYSADQVIGELAGSFAFVLFDNKMRKLLVASDPQGKVEFYWGTAADGAIAFSDDAKLLKEGCGKSFAPFPQGCFFSSADGLHSFEHPMSTLKPVSRVDSQGQMCGSFFKVDKKGWMNGLDSPSTLGRSMTFPFPDHTE
ncbi:hypothetical protein CY35_12G045400 [Sphagnum magellanicum]|nr:hypothetical protein CY35_12G045400 [Sphagnum magellanicum]KAH9545390.1 hypothetical protein CY35_12G045400 [Sphagnum magellanicum]KAH9545391.1 hypothetical protein CY35_12G045400 [Sphagnum magellanicum]